MFYIEEMYKSVSLFQSGYSQEYISKLGRLRFQIVIELKKIFWEDCPPLLSVMLTACSPSIPLVISSCPIIPLNYNNFQLYGCLSIYMFVCTFRNPPLAKPAVFFPVTALVMLSAPASDDEGSTAATDGSTLRTSPAEHGGSVGSESGGSAIDSVAGEHNGKTGFLLFGRFFFVYIYIYKINYFEVYCFG